MTSQHSQDAQANPTEESASPWWQRDRIALMVLVAFTALLWFMRRRGPAMAMEESMMIHAPMRVVHGAIQGRDFDYFYGPVSLWLPAAAYKVAAPTLIVERAVGACYLAALGIALAFIGRRWSFWIGLAMGAIAILIGALSITALPIVGAIAGLVGALAFTVSDLRPTAKAWTTGLVLAISVGLRPDFLVWSLVLLTVLSLLGAARLRTWIAFAVGLVPYAVLVARAGWSNVWRTLVSDGLHVGAERHLPYELHLGERGALVVISGATIIAAIVLGIARRRERRGVALVGLGIIGACLVPEYVQRADGIHVVYVTMVPLAAMVVVIVELVGFSGRLRHLDGWRQCIALGVSAVLLFGVQPKFLLRSTFRDMRVISAGGIVYAAHNRGGAWYYRSAAAARDHAAIARAATRMGHPGAVLFVGPLDLSRTSYSDGSFYTLLPQFNQRTRFYDFHPRIALDYGKRLAADVNAADLLILCDVGFNEANLSAHPGSVAANRVVATHFSEVTRAGNCRLYRRNRTTTGDQ